MTIKEYVAKQKQLLCIEVEGLQVKPSFVIIQVNDDPASDSYIRGKIKDAGEVGIEVKLDKLSPTISEEGLLKVVNKYNNDPKVHGLIVQMPLPKHISEDRVKLSVNPKKRY